MQPGAWVWRRNGHPLKLLKNWQEKNTGGGWGGCLSLKKQTYIFALFKACFHPSILCCFEQICTVTWRNIKAINLRRCGRSKRRPQRLVLMKKKKKLPAVISWLLKLAPGGWQNGFIPGWAVRGHRERQGLLCIYCVRRWHVCSWNKVGFFCFVFF